MAKLPPGKVLCKIVLPLVRDFTSAILSLILGVSRHIGASRSLLQASPISIVGCTINIGDGSTSTKYPIILLRTSVFPNCAPTIKTVPVASGSLIESIHSRAYGVRSEEYFPGCPDDSGERKRYWSAHSETVTLGGGSKTKSHDWAISCTCKSIFYLFCNFLSSLFKKLSLFSKLILISKDFFISSLKTNSLFISLLILLITKI